MFKINRLKLDIRASDVKDTKSISSFGFDIPFSKGLNVIKGENTSGKSTTVACIYFGLGLEIILGGKNRYGLDKALHKKFDANNTSFNVLLSSVYLEVENDIGNLVTIHRYIKGEKDDAPQHIRIYESKLSEISSNTKVINYFIHRVGDHDSDIGFYNWLSKFIGLDLPSVLDYENNYTRLYLQSIFPAFFIEQTKGWSDFLGAQPNFNIKDNKIRVIEYLLELNALFFEVEKEKLESSKKELSKQWAIIYDKINMLSNNSLSKISNLPKEPTKDKNVLALASLKIKQNFNDTDSVLIDDYLQIMKQNSRNIDTNPKIVTSQSNIELQKRLYIKLEELDNYRESEKEFLLEFNSQKHQLLSYQQFLKDIKKEIQANKDIEYLKKKDSTINTLSLCPTCSQTIDLRSIKKNIDVELKTISSNIMYLENQKKLLESSISSLDEILTEKNIIESYFIKDIRKLEEEIKYIKNELCDPDLMPSRVQIYEKMQIDNEIKNTEELKESYEELKGELNNLSEDFENIEIELESFKDKEKSDTIKLDAFNNKFKELLFKFGYSSNNEPTISIQKTQPFKYLPVVRVDNYSQRIKISSSASDFVRSNWAYTVALLLESKIHPGILVLDEPSQHSMKSSSLKKFFYELSKLNQYQVIVAASTERKGKVEDNISYTLDEVLEGIQYNPITIDKKAIALVD